jgi:hypothetical protein
LPLKILLIASNTPPDIPGVDAEIAELEKALPSLFKEHGIETDIRTVPTKEASFDTVIKLLRKCE